MRLLWAGAGARSSSAPPRRPCSPSVSSACYSQVVAAATRALHETPRGGCLVVATALGCGRLRVLDTR
jgi:hypothetical protein